MEVPLTTITATTDALATLSVAVVGFTYVSLAWTNTSGNAASTYRVIDASGGVVLDTIEVAANGQTAQDVRGLTPNTAYSWTLQRYEFGVLVDQSSVHTTTYTTALTTSASQYSISVSFPIPVIDANYIVTCSNSFSETTTLRGLVKSSGTASGYFTNLTPNASYVVRLYVVEVGEQLLDAHTASTSNLVLLTAPTVRASFVVLSWSSSNDSYRITNGGVTADEGTGNTSTITNLKPGTTYTFVLLSADVDGSYVQQGSVTISTATSVLSIVGVGSTTVSLQWSSAYDGAMYAIKYGTNANDLVEFTRTGALQAVVTGLLGATNYTVMLETIENNNYVPLGRAAFGTLGAPSPKMTITVSVVAVIAALLVIAYMLRRAKKA